LLLILDFFVSSLLYRVTRDSVDMAHENTDSPFVLLGLEIQPHSFPLPHGEKHTAAFAYIVRKMAGICFYAEQFVTSQRGWQLVQPVIIWHSRCSFERHVKSVVGFHGAFRGGYRGDIKVNIWTMMSVCV
jgi:hypothetical protein